MVPEKKNHTALAVSALIVLAALLLGLWPILILMSPILLIYSLCQMAAKRPVRTVPIQPLAALPAPATEQSVRSMAFGVLQNRITEAVRASYPAAQWTWMTGNAQEQFAAGNSLWIMLNGAGGYRKALVLVRELQFCGLVYETANRPANIIPDTNAAEPATEPETQEETEDYGLLAFEWVEANMQQLNARGNEAVAKGQDGFRILAEELPHGDGWPAICAELIRCGFSKAEVLADGIHVQSKIEKGA